MGKTQLFSAVYGHTTDCTSLKDGVFGWFSPNSLVSIGGVDCEEMLDLTKLVFTVYCQ